MATSSHKSVLKRVFKQLKKYKLFIAATVLFALISVAGNLLAPIFVGQIIDLLILGEQVQLAKVFEKVVAIGVTVGITCLAQWLTSVINNHITFNVVKDIRENAFTHLQKLPLKFIDAHSYGDIVGRAYLPSSAYLSLCLQ